MGTFGKKIAEVDTEALIKELNKALADEWLAYYQYWVGAKIVKGQMSNRVKEELEEHAEEELKHADMLTERILQLGGIPLLSPDAWSKEKNCAYLTPTKFSSTEILKQNIQGEQCAIIVYQKLLKMTHNKDEITYQMILEILKEEVEHEDDLENILEDLTY